MKKCPNQTLSYGIRRTPIYGAQNETYIED